MDRKYIDEIKSRLNNCTDGEWLLEKDSDDSPFITDIWLNGHDEGHIEIHGLTPEQSYLDAEFIAHSKKDVPALLAEIERLRELLKKIKEIENTNLYGWGTEIYKICKEALGEEE